MANNNLAALPSFERPPVSEVVLSIQFASLEQFRSAHVGLFWDTIRDKYPDVVEQPPIDAAFETFGAPTNTMPLGMRLETFLSPPTPRYWFQKPGEPWLLQIQQDRIVFNWRKLDDEKNIYPRYEPIRAKFVAEFDGFSNFLKRENLGTIEPNQCEVTYVNTIELPDVLDAHPMLKEVTPLWSGETTYAPPAELENILVQSRYIFTDGKTKIGRTYVKIQPAIRQADRRSVFKVEITARAKPENSSVDSAFTTLDLAREQVVKTFAAVTTPSMHKLWGKEDAR